MENQIPCDNCNWLENESELIETFDNQLLCSPCYIKKEFNNFKKSNHRRRFSRFKQRGNNESKPFKKNYFERFSNNEHRRKKKFRFKKHRRKDQNRAF